MTDKDKITDYASIHGQPGSRARLSGILRAALPLCVALVLCGYAFGLLLPSPQIGVAAQCLLVVVAAIALMLATSLASHRIDNFFKGASGEVAAAWALARLPAGYSVFHGVDISKSRTGLRTHDIDHVVLTPCGIVVIETKNWRGALSFEGGAITIDGIVPGRDPLEQVSGQARALSEWLSGRLPDKPSVTPVLCFVGDALGAGAPAELGGVKICGDAELASIVEKAGDSLPLPKPARERIASLLSKTV